MAHGELKSPRGRNFAMVQRLDNMPDDWRDRLEELGLPIAYVVHDKDVYGERDDKRDLDRGEASPGSPVPAHVHIFVYFSGKRTVSGVVEMFSDFNVKYAQKIECKNAYLAYMLHLRQEGKHTYGYDEMVILNGLKVNFADLSDIDFNDVIDFADEYGITRFGELVRATKAKEPALFRYVTSHYALTCAFFADEREG